MKLKILLLLMLPMFAFGQSITPSFRAVTGGLMTYTYPGKSPTGLDTLWNAQTIRGYVSSHAAVYNFLNGLTNDGGGNVLWGGTLTSNVDILGPYEFNMGLGDFSNNFSSFGVASNQVTIGNSFKTIGGSSISSFLNLLQHKNNIGILSPFGLQQFEFSANATTGGLYSALFTDSLKKGILYNWSDDSNLSDSSLVPKRFVTHYADSVSSIGTASGGIEKSANDYRLGSGTLQGDVLVDAGSNNWILGDLTALTGIFAYQPGAGATMAGNGSGFASGFQANNGQLNIYFQQSSPAKSNNFRMVGGNMTFTDGFNHRGPVGDNSITHSAYIGKSFIDKDYADSTAKAKADSVVSAHPGGGGSVTSITPGYGFTNATPITTSGTLTIDSTKFQTVLNLFPKADTRYYNKTLSDGRYQPLEDQRVSTTNSPSFVKESITGTAGSGYVDLISQSASPGALTNHLRLYSDSLNRVSWKNSLYRRTIQVPYPTDYTIRMPWRATQTTLVDSTDAKAAYTYTAGYGTSITSNAIKVDTALIETITNFFPKGDTRYYTKTASDAKYLPLAGGTMSGTINTQTGLPNTNNTYNWGSSSLLYASIFGVNFNSGSSSLGLIAGSGANINISAGATQYAKLFGGTGNFTFQTGGTFTDGGYRVDIRSTGTNGYLRSGNLIVDASGNAQISTLSKIIVTEGTNGRVGQATLTAGTVAITISGLTTSSRAFVQLVSPNTTSSTASYQAVCTSNTLTIQANIAAGTINILDISTLNYFVLN